MKDGDLYETGIEQTEIGADVSNWGCIKMIEMIVIYVKLVPMQECFLGHPKHCTTTKNIQAISINHKEPFL